MLWSLAADQRRWGLVADAAETRRLALSVRVRDIMTDALRYADVVRRARF